MAPRVARLCLSIVLPASLVATAVLVMLVVLAVRVPIDSGESPRPASHLGSEGSRSVAGRPPASVLSMLHPVFDVVDVILSAVNDFFPATVLFIPHVHFPYSLLRLFRDPSATRVLVVLTQPPGVAPAATAVGGMKPLVDGAQTRGLPPNSVGRGGSPPVDHRPIVVGLFTDLKQVVANMIRMLVVSVTGLTGFYSHTIHATSWAAAMAELRTRFAGDSAKVFAATPGHLRHLAIDQLHVWGPSDGDPEDGWFRRELSKASGMTTVGEQIEGETSAAAKQSKWIASLTWSPNALVWFRTGSLFAGPQGRTLAQAFSEQLSKVAPRGRVVGHTCHLGLWVHGCMVMLKAGGRPGWGDGEVGSHSCLSWDVSHPLVTTTS